MNNRVLEVRNVLGRDLIANPANWRRHTDSQRRALRAIVDEVGFAGAAIAWQTDAGLELIDGHLRAEEYPDDEIPVLVLDVSSRADAEKILATYDPLGAMARPDMDALVDLLGRVEFASPDVNRLLEAVANGETAFLPDLTHPDPPTEFPTYDPNALSTEHKCPSCGYEWSGAARP